MKTENLIAQSTRSLRPREAAQSAESSANEQRRWWQVRGTLWAVLLVVCTVSGTVSTQGEVRSALRATVFRPLAMSASSLADWSGWAPLGFAVSAGTLAGAGLRRVRLPLASSKRAGGSLN